MKPPRTAQVEVPSPSLLYSHSTYCLTLKQLHSLSSLYSYPSPRWISHQWYTSLNIATIKSNFSPYLWSQCFWVSHVHIYWRVEHSLENYFLLYLHILTISNLLVSYTDMFHINMSIHILLIVNFHNGKKYLFNKFIIWGSLISY